MAIIHQATLRPTKLELLAQWLPGQPWSTGDQVTKLGSYRFDDPAGEVGLESFLIDTGDGVVQVPLSYRGDPLAGAEDFLIGTMEHSVLGTRYVYDAVGDPVWATALATAIVTGGREADEEITGPDGTTVVREATVRVRGSGDASTGVPSLPAVVTHTESGLTSIASGRTIVIMVRRIGSDLQADNLLTGRWADGPEVVLAGVTSDV
jgi:hypothetical protein